MAEPGSVHVISVRGRTRVVLSGEVDADLAPALLESTADALESAVELEVDMQHVTFMDSTGVAFLARLAKDSPSPVRVLRPTAEVRYLLDITGVAGLLSMPEPDGDAGTDGGGDGDPATNGDGGRGEDELAGRRAAGRDA